MKVGEKEIDLKPVWNAFRRVFICLGGGVLATAVTLFMGLRLPYCITAGVITLGGVAATILWKTNRRRYDDWYDVAVDVGFLTLFGSVLLFLVGAFFGAGWWTIHSAFGGMIAAFFIMLVGLKAFPKPEA
jgi:hypothetical protein